MSASFDFLFQHMKEDWLFYYRVMSLLLDSCLIQQTGSQLLSQCKNCLKLPGSLFEQNKSSIFVLFCFLYTSLQGWPKVV